MSTLSDALDYAARGWHVFPLAPRSKEPLKGSRGFNDASTNPATMRRWFGQGYPYNIGIGTGMISGLFMLDIDGGTAPEPGAIRSEARATADDAASHQPRPALWFSAPAGSETRASSRPGSTCARMAAMRSRRPRSIQRRRLSVAQRYPTGAGTGLAGRAGERKPPPPAHCRRRGPAGSHSLCIVGCLRPRRARSRDRAARARLKRHAQRRAELRELPPASTGRRRRARGRRGRAERLVAAAHANGLMSDPEDGPRSAATRSASGANAGLRLPRDRHGRR